MSSESKITTDKNEIMKWAKARGGKPAAVKTKGGDVGILRIDFPGYSGGESLQEITWDEFFKKFEQEKLAFLFRKKLRTERKAGFLN
ncbi:MAG TPA: hypothetical protein VHO28_09725 [Ignavibacteriales bacterium]|nr:hypothetical protein [Ignavibacteriales bacterium]